MPFSSTETCAKSMRYHRRAYAPQTRVRRGRVGVFFQEVVLDLPGVIIAELVGEFDLRQRVLIKRLLIARLPGARQLEFVKYSKFHWPAPVV
jgi:hypothetical protein